MSDQRPEPLPAEYRATFALPEAGGAIIAGACAECGRAMEQVEVLGLRSPRWCLRCDEARTDTDLLSRSLRLQRENRKVTVRRVVPPLYRELATKPDRAYPEPAWRAIKGWQPVHDESLIRGRGLLITGPTGTWKSTMAAHRIGQVHVETGWTIAWLSMPAWEAALRQGWDGDADGKREAAKMRKDARSARLLVLDDLGKEGSTEAVEREVFALLDHRMARMKPTFITLNADPEHFRARLSADRAGPLLRRIAGPNLHIDTANPK